MATLSKREHEIMDAAFRYAKHRQKWQEERGNGDLYTIGDVEIGFLNGANFADFTRWRATAEQLPTERGQYLAATKHGLHVAEFIPQSESNEIFPAGWHTFTGILLDVTHWQSLPTNPNERKGGTEQWQPKD